MSQAALAAAACLAAAAPYLDAKAPLETRVEDLMGRLTLDEKISLLAGATPMTLAAIPRLSIPSVKMTDGPTGVRSPEGDTATVFPVGVAIAATWNPDLAGEVGGAIAEEAQALGAQVLLAPTVNIVRTPRWGRNFETYSEDPLLAGAMGAGYVKGVQAKGVGTSLKHFAVNNQESNRFFVSAEVGERPLHEIYLPAFEAVVKTAHPWSVMASYNRINGTYASEDRWLLTDLLKTQWAYDGVVVSDWGAVHATVPSPNAGMDLEMPGPPKHFGPKLRAAVDAGQVSPAQIDDNARRVVRLILRTGVLDGKPPPKGAMATPAHRDVARRAAEEAIVLLKNQRVLPLPAGIKTLAVIGPNAAVARVQGGGSSAVKPYYSVTPLEALKQALPGVEVVYAQGVDNEDAPPLAPAEQFSPDEGRSAKGLAATYFPARDFASPPGRTGIETDFQKRVSGAIAGPATTGYGALRWEGRFWPPASGRYEFSIRGTGEATLWLDGEAVIDKALKPAYDKRDVTGLPTARRTVAVELEAGRSYPVRLDYVTGATPYETLSFGVRQPGPSLDEAVAAARGADAAVVLVGSNSTTEGEGYDRDDLSLPRGQDELVAAVLAANPRTAVVVNAGAAMTMPWADQAPAILAAWLPGQEGPHALADILTGKVNPSGKLPVSFPARTGDDTATGFPGGARSDYAEGLLVGYRGLERQGIAPLFPFGHGLSYASFAYSGLKAPRSARAGGPVEVTLRLRNTGARPGKEVVQLYVAPAAAGADEPVKALRAFRKVEVPAGASRTVRLSLPPRAFSIYDVQAHGWVVRPGAYRLMAGASSADIRLTADLQIEGN